MGPWSEHGNAWYNCNRFDENSSKEARDSQSKSRAFLERYLHYYNRFANHEQSARLEEQLYKKIETKMEEMQRGSDLSWIECQFLRHSVDVLTECRTTLKWTYAFAYYLERNNQTEIFEDNQRDLELAVEQLSGMLEMPVEDMIVDLKELKRKMQDKAKYVEDRRDILLEDTSVGLLDDRWRYNVQL
jgi:ariadne-1